MSIDANTADFEAAIRASTIDAHLRQVVRDMSSAFDIPEPQVCWWEYAQQHMENEPDYAALLIQAGVRSDIINGQEIVL